MTVRPLTPLAILVTTVSAAAQISDGNVRYAWLPPVPVQLDSTEAIFTANPESDQNVLFEQWWAYRVAGDPEEVYLNSFNYTQSSAGSHADLDWSDLDGRGLLRAELDLDVVSTGAIGGTLTARMTLTNIGSTVLTVDLFHYVDLDLCTALPNNAAGVGTDHVVIGGCEDLDFVEVSAFGADRYSVAPFTVDECGITAPGTIDLPNTGLPFGPGDYSSAFQWSDRILTPGNVLIAIVELDHNPPFCSTPASVVSYGNPSPSTLHGGLQLGSELPVVGHVFSLFWTGTLPSAPGILLIGDTRTSFPLANVSIQVVPVIDAPIGSDPLGNGILDFTLLDPAFCGTTLAFQALFLDDSATPLPLCHTQGLELQFGR